MNDRQPGDYIPFDVFSEFAELFEELGPATVQGDKAAGMQLSEELKRLARRRTVHKSDHEDALQDVFVTMLEIIRDGRLTNKVYRNILEAIGCRDLAALRGHLKAAVSFKSGEWNKRARRRGKFEVQGQLASEDACENTDGAMHLAGSALEQLVHEEELERLRRAIECLNPRERTIVERFHLEGKTHQEIAEELGITEQRSRQLVSKARKTLKLTLSDSGATGL